MTDPERTIRERLDQLELFTGSEPRKIEMVVSSWIEALADAADADLLQLISKLRSLGVSSEFIRYWRQSILTTRKEKLRAGRPPAVSGLHPYVEKDGELYLLVPHGEDVVEVPIASLTARIVTETADELGGRSFSIEGQTTAGRNFSFTLPADAFSQDHCLEALILQHAGASAVVRAGMSRHLRPAIQLLTDTPPLEIKRYARTGWVERLFLIPGAEPKHVEIDLPGKLPYCLDARSDLKLGLQALHNLVQAQSAEKVLIALAFVFQAALANPLGWRSERYGLFIAGRTGAFKTSIAQLMMSLFGPGFLDENALIRWGIGATTNSIVTLSTHASDLPFLVDNFKPNTGQGARDLVNLVHALMEGSEKDRLRRDATLRPVRPIHTWLMLTGEDPATRDPATLARLLIVRFEARDAVSNQALSAAQQNARHLNAVGAAWLRWLISGSASEVFAQAREQLPKLREGWMRYLQSLQARTVNPARVATNLASNQLTWWVLLRHPELGGFAEQYAELHRQGLAAVAAEMALLTGEALEANRFLETLVELITSGRCLLLSAYLNPTDLDRDRFIGWRSGDGSFYLLPELARLAVERVLGAGGLNNLSNATLYSQLASLGLIQSSDTGRHTKNVRVDSAKVVRTLHLKPEALRIEV